MAQPLIVSMPDGVDIGPSYMLQVAAQDPNTGAAVTGVTISGFVIEAESMGSGTLDSGAFLLVPGPGA